MKSIRKWFLPLLLLTACHPHAPEGTALITGKIAGGQGATWILEELDPMGSVVLDSVTADAGGVFHFPVNATEASFYMLKTLDGRMTIVTAKPGDTIHVTGDLSRFPEEVTVDGSADARLLSEFYRHASRNKALSDSLQSILASHRDDSLFTPLTLKFDSIFQHIWDDQRTFNSEFIRKHPSSFASLLVVNFSFGTRPVLSPDSDRTFYLTVDSALSIRYPGNRHVEYNKKNIAGYVRREQLDRGTNH